MASASSCEPEQNPATQKISVPDNVNGLQYTAAKSDNYVIEMDSFSHVITKDSSPNPRTTRNLSRKGSKRHGDKKNDFCTTSSERDPGPAASTSKGCSTADDKATLAAAGTADNNTNAQVHHQITITTGSNGSTLTQSKSLLRRNSGKWSPSSVLDPRRVICLFATMSSVGTILLIYFTIAINKRNQEAYYGAWQ